jgi:hypothetical protein
MLAIIASFITRHYLSVINSNAVGEFTPVPHFVGDVDLSYKLSMIPIFVVFLVIFVALAFNKFFLSGISLIGVFAAVTKYKTITETVLPVEMVFIQGLLVLASTLCFFMIIAIIVQWIFDGGYTAIKLVNKNKRKK